MKEVAGKLAELEMRASSERGEFTLFALFLRESSPDVWDLLVSGPWISKDKHSALGYLTDQIGFILTPEELTMLSRIVIIEDDNPGLEAFHRAINVKHGLAEVINSVFFGLEIEHAYIITSQRLQDVGAT